ncbi:MAG TPA: DNA adenine methylase [Caldithrix sp.]|nr:DNA adenine methylase [Caldithrix sp.]
MEAKPYKTYFGGKEGAGVYQTIINHIPKHKTLIIPFLGNCAIFRKIASADNTILIDKDPEVIKNWCTIIKNYDRSGITLINDDSISYLQKCRVGPETVIYADPPYPLNVRNSCHQYNFDFTDKDHVKLLKTLLQLDCKILISTYQNDLYSKMLWGWNKTMYPGRTRQGIRYELLYYNFNLNDIELHDYSYLGKNFRERERIKKKIHRYSSKLKRLQRFESLAIINKLSRDLIIKNDDVISLMHATNQNPNCFSLKGLRQQEDIKV